MWNNLQSEYQVNKRLSHQTPVKRATHAINKLTESSDTVELLSSISSLYSYPTWFLAIFGDLRIQDISDEDEPSST